MALPDHSERPVLSRWVRWSEAWQTNPFWLWAPGLLLAAFFGFLMGRAVPVSQVAPFGIAFYAAMRSGGMRAGVTVAAFLAVAVGAWSVLPPISLIGVAAALAFVHFGILILRPARRVPAMVKAGVVASTAAAIPGLVLSGSIAWITILFWCFLAGVLALLFTLGIKDLRSGRTAARIVADSPVPVIVIMVAAVSGLEGLMVGEWLSLRDVAAGLLVLGYGFAGGPSVGAAAGALLGISFLVAGVAPAPGTNAALLPESRSMAYVVAGLLGGAFRDLRKGGVAAAFFLGMVTFSMITVQETALLFTMGYSAAVAALLFLMLPTGWFSALPEALVVSENPVPTETESAVEQAGPVIRQVEGMVRALREVSKAFEQVAAVAAPTDQEAADLAFEQVTQRLCRNCSLFRQCWDRELPRTYQLYKELWREIETGGAISAQFLPESLEQHCIYPVQVALTLNYMHDLHRSQRLWERKLSGDRAVAGEYVRNISRMLEQFGTQLSEPKKESETTPTLQVLFGVARLAKRGGHICGDSYLGTFLGPDRFLLALSDGMGVGEVAAEESRQCLKLLQELLGAGFAVNTAVHTANSALLLRSPRERFVTLDLGIIEMGTGRTEFVKIGAAPSFLKRGTHVTVIKKASVPIGIMPRTEVESEFRTLRPGDILVMVTDGIWDVAREEVDKERWILSQLSREEETTPEVIAEGLLAGALELMPDAGDDMTVLVARIEEADGTGATAGPRLTSSTWVPVRQAPKKDHQPIRRVKQ